MQIHVHYIYCFASFYIICIEYILVKVKIWINVWCVKLSNLYSVISQHSSSYQITLPKLRKWLSFTKELETHFVSRWCTSYFSVFDQSFFILALAITHTHARARTVFSSKGWFVISLYNIYLRLTYWENRCTNNKKWVQKYTVSYIKYHMSVLGYPISLSASCLSALFIFQISHPITLLCFFFPFISVLK